ncbi:MAG: DUF2271 domain-containing protein [Bacteroidales bacterium]
MKRNLFFSLLNVFTLSLIISGFSDASAQTAGTFTFTYTQTAPSGTATKNVMAVWIEDSATATFIKTKMRFWGNNTTDHLPSWVAKSAQNLTDATTGATRTATTSPTAFGVKTISWNGTNVSGAVVPDGKYKVFIESSYCTPEPSNGQHWLIYSFTFTKGATAQHLTPTCPANFSNISLDWTPSASSVAKINELSGVNVFPNPSNGIINVDIQHAFTGTILIENSIGMKIYDENIIVSNATVKSINLAKFTNGTYYVKIQRKNSLDSQKFKIILNK